MARFDVKYLAYEVACCPMCHGGRAPLKTRRCGACGVEHSDSWSATSFLDLKADVVEMLTAPSGRFVDFALMTLASCAGEITSAFGRFYGFDVAGATAEMDTLAREAFLTEPRR